MAQVVAVQEIDLALLSAAYKEIGAVADRGRQDHGATGAEVGIVGVESVLVERREIIDHVQPTTGGQLNETIAQAVGIHVCIVGVKSAIARFKIEVAVPIDGRCLAALPYASIAAIGVGVVSRSEGKGSSIVTKYPAVVGRIITVGSVADVNGAIEQHQAWPVQLPQGIELDHPANTPVTVSRDRRTRHIGIAPVVDRIADHDGSRRTFQLHW